MQKASAATMRTVQEAVRRRDVNRVRQILNNCKNEQVIRSALCTAINLNDTSMLQSILDQVKHSNVSDNLYQQKHCASDHYRKQQFYHESEQPVSPLHVACSKDNAENVSLLLKAGFTTHVVDGCGETPLHIVCRLGNIDCVRSLLSCGADVNACTLGRITPLYTACFFGYYDIVEALLQSGAKINRHTELGAYDGFTVRLRESERKFARYPRLFVKEYKQPEIVSELIIHLANIEIKLHNNGTPLHVACIMGTLQMVKALVNNGSCINAETHSGQTPLFYCLRNASYLVSIHKNPICIHRPNKKFFFEESIQKGNDIMEYLIQEGATLSCKDDSGRTPLEHAIMTNRTSSFFILLKYGGRLPGERLDTFPWNWRREDLPGVAHHLHVYRILLRSNFEFRRFLPVYLEKLRDLKSTESFLSFLKEIQQPLSLKDQCRISIRNMISTDTGVQLIRSINTLGLPKLLQGFLMLDDFDQDEFRREI